MVTDSDMPQHRKDRYCRNHNSSKILFYTFFWRFSKKASFWIKATTSNQSTCTVFWKERSALTYRKRWLTPTTNNTDVLISWHIEGDLPIIMRWRTLRPIFGPQDGVYTQTTVTQKKNSNTGTMMDSIELGLPIDAWISDQPSVGELVQRHGWCKRPWFRNWRRTEQSMILVKQSAICAALWTHLTTMPSCNRSLMIKDSSIVRYSWHWGTIVFWRRSYKLLQSTTAYAFGHCWRALQRILPTAWWTAEPIPLQSQPT